MSVGHGTIDVEKEDVLVLIVARARIARIVGRTEGQHGRWTVLGLLHWIPIPKDVQ